MRPAFHSVCVLVDVPVAVLTTSMQLQDGLVPCKKCVCSNKTKLSVSPTTFFFLCVCVKRPRAVPNQHRQTSASTDGDDGAEETFEVMTPQIIARKTNQS